MHSAGKAVISATRFLRKVRGGSQSSLVEASDGFLYVIKSIENVQGANLLCNEVLGTELYRALHLPTPEWMPVQVSLSFAKNNPGCWIEAADEFRFPTGLCFGSRLASGRADRLLEILPGRYLERVQNRNDFWRAWVADACADHQDDRQAVFERDPDGVLNASFIDHGHMFGGPGGGSTSRPQLPRYVDRRVYPAPTPTLKMQLAQFGDRLDADQLNCRVETMPDYWKTGSAMRNFKMCLERLSTARVREEIVNSIVASFLSLTANERTSPQFDAAPQLPLLHACIPAGEFNRAAVA